MSYFDQEPSHGRGEAVAAATVAIALHLAAFALLLLTGQHGSDGRDLVGAKGDDGLVVEFVSIAAHSAPQGAAQPSSQANATTSLSVPTTKISQLGDLASDQKTAEQSPSAAPGRGSPSKVDMSVETPAPPASEDGGKFGAGGPNDGYLAAIKTAILRRWGTLHPGETAPACTLAIEQVTGGQLKATQASNCTEGQRRSLEAAALMAQPLPYAGYEAEFQAQVTIAFN